MLVQGLAHLARVVVDLLFDLAEPCFYLLREGLEIGRALLGVRRAVLLLGLELGRQFFDFATRVTVESFDPFFHVTRHSVQVIHQLFLEIDKPLIEVPHLAAEQNLANLVDIAFHLVASVSRPALVRFFCH